MPGRRLCLIGPRQCHNGLVAERDELEGRPEKRPDPGPTETASATRRDRRWSVSLPTLRTGKPSRTRYPENRARRRAQVPEHHTAVGADDQYPPIMPDRRIPILVGHARGVGQCTVFEGRIDLVRGQVVLIRQNDSSVLAEVARSGRAGQAQPGSAQDRIPEPQPAFPAVARQQCSGGVKGGIDSAVRRAFEGRLLRASGGVPEVYLGIIKGYYRQRGAVGTPGDRCASPTRQRK